jgi:hypothetical protein
MSIVWRDATICDGGLSKVWRGMRQSAMVVEVLIRRRVATLLLEYRKRQLLIASEHCGCAATRASRDYSQCDAFPY